MKTKSWSERIARAVTLWTGSRLLHRYYSELAHLAKRDHDLTKSHSIEEANRRHSRKTGAGKEEST